jgi:hypothetical protein
MGVASRRWVVATMNRFAATNLILAISSNDLHATRDILMRSSHRIASCRDQRAALHAAVANENIPMDLLLHSFGYTQYCTCDKCRACLEHMARTDFGDVRANVRYVRASNQTSRHIETPIQFSVRRRLYHVVQALIDEGDDPNEVASDWPIRTFNALSIALERADIDMVQLLARNGASLNSGHLSIALGTNCQLMRVVLSLPPSSTALPPTMGNAFAFVQSVDMARLLLESGDATFPRRAALHDAVRSLTDCSFDVAKLIIEQLDGVIDALDHYGQSPLFHAVQWQLTHKIALLLVCGANVNLVDRSNCTPLQLCRGIESAALLLAGGAEDRAGVFYRLDRLGSQISYAMRKLARTRARLIRMRVLQICTGLQSAAWPALVTLSVIDVDCTLASFVPMHTKWKMIVAVKHFHDKQKCGAV